MRYKLGNWIVSGEQNSLTDGDEIRHLDNKSMQVLMLLIENSGKQVTKEQLFNAIWKDKFVSDDILSVAISNTRKALGDNARKPTFIKTIPSVGYCLIADVTEIYQAQQTVTTDSTKNLDINSVEFKKDGSLNITKSVPLKNYALLIAFIVFATLSTVYLIDFSQLTTKKSEEVTPTNVEPSYYSSIAVLPFKDFSDGKSGRYLTDGLAEAVIGKLANVNTIKVISHYSSFSFRDKIDPVYIGNELKVTAILDGSVQKMGNQVRIITRLINTKNGEHIWSKTFDRDSQFVFNIQDEISQAVINVITNKPVTVPPSQKISEKSYESFLWAQYYWQQRTPKSLANAIKTFDSVLKQEPDYAKAHLGLAISNFFLVEYSDWSLSKATKKAWPALNRALELSPELADAHATKGLILSFEAYASSSKQDKIELYLQSERAFLHALSLSENNALTYQWYANLLRVQGKVDKAQQMMEKALEINPLSSGLYRSVAFSYLELGEINKAQSLYGRSLVITPDQFYFPIDNLTFNRLTSKSALALKKWQELNGFALKNCPDNNNCDMLAATYLSLGDQEKAKKWLPKAQDSFWLQMIMENHQQNHKNVVEILIKETSLHTSIRNRQHLAKAYLRSGDDLRAAEQIEALVPQIKIPNFTITTENYALAIDYAAALFDLEKTDKSTILLKRLDAFLAKNKLRDTAHAYLKRSEINTLLGNVDIALKHFEQALNLGWMSDLNKEWWLIEDNKILLALNEHEKYHQLINKAKTMRVNLRNQFNKRA